MAEVISQIIAALQVLTYHAFMRLCNVLPECVACTYMLRMASCICQFRTPPHTVISRTYRCVYRSVGGRAFPTSICDSQTLVFLTVVYSMIHDIHYKSIVCPFRARSSTYPKDMSTWLISHTWYRQVLCYFLIILSVLYDCRIIEWCSSCHGD